MKWLWSYKKLKKLCERKKPLIREWAFSKLVHLYPRETADTALLLLLDENEHISKAAGNFFSENGIEGSEDSLVEIYKKSSGSLSTIVAGVLSRWKSESFIEVFKAKCSEKNYLEDLPGCTYSLLFAVDASENEVKDHVEMALRLLGEFENKEMEHYADVIFATCLLARLDIAELLRFCFRHPLGRDILLELLAEIGKYCGAWYERGDLADTGSSMVIEEVVTDIVNQGGKKKGKEIEKLFEKKKYENVVELVYKDTLLLLKERGVEPGTEAYLEWWEGDGKPRYNVEAIRAFHEVMGEAPQPEKEMLAVAAVAVFAMLLEFRPLIGLKVEELEKKDALEIFLQDRDSAAEDGGIAEMLIGGLDKEELIDTCLEFLQQSPDSSAVSRVFDLLTEVGDVDVLAEVAAIVPEDHELWDDIVPRLKEHGAAVFPYVRSIVEGGESEKLDYYIGVLEVLPADETVELLLKNWKYLWEHCRESLLRAVFGIADRRFVSPLRKEVRLGEFAEGEVFCLLCQVNGVIDPLVKKVEKSLKKKQKGIDKRMQMVLEGDIEAFSKEPLGVELKCRKCGRAYIYEIEKVIFDPKTAEKYIFDAIRCKYCGVVDHYEITPVGVAVFTTALLLFSSILQEKGKIPEDGVVSIGTLNLVDGKRIALPQAIDEYEVKLQKEPDNPALLVGFANLMRSSKRTEDAIPLYRRALEVDPLAVEAYISLADIVEKKGEPETAYDYYRKVIDIFDSAHFYKTEDVEAAYKHTVHIFNHLAEKLKKPVPRLNC